MADFIIEELAPEQVRAVYPLVREAFPPLDLPAWVRFARQLTGPRRKGQSGIIAIRREARIFPCGLFCYRVEDDLELGKVLTADHFVAVDLLEPATVLVALVEELDDLAKQLGCQAVRSVVHGGEPGVANGLQAAGHRPETTSLLLKRLRQPHCGRDTGAESRRGPRVPQSVIA